MKDGEGQVVCDIRMVRRTEAETGRMEDREE